MNDESPRPVITIHPEPPPEEVAAIVVAVTVVLTGSAPSPEPPARPVSRWAKQGRLDAMSGLSGNDRTRP